MNILIVNSDDQAADSIAFGLRQRGHQTQREISGLIAFSLAVDNPFDAILIDDSLPYLQGVEVAQHLRRRRVRKPILLTAHNDSAGYRRVAQDSGVDDLLIKPVTASEIEAHIDAILRPAATSAMASRLYVGDLEIDLGARTVVRGGRRISLTRTQIRLLWALADQPDTIVSRESLYSSVLKYRDGALPATLSSLMAGLRRRLTVPGKRDPIVTARGLGYMLTTDSDTPWRGVRTASVEPSRPNSLSQ
jgi:DNA-binding response OmpR family regulator